MTTIFIVQGCQGEYSDRSEWPVRAFATKPEAEEFQLLCAEESIRVKEEDRALAMSGDGIHYEARSSIVSKYDPHCRGWLYDDVTYGVVECAFGPIA